MNFTKTPLSFFCALLMLAAFAFPAHSQIYKIPLKNPFPVCDDEKVLKKIVKRFNWAERKTWHNGFELIAISRPHLHHNHGFKDSPIERRFCHGYAKLSNGRTKRIHYMIEEGAGLAGFGWGVTFCVVGLDPWRIYDASCRVLRRYH